MILFKTIQKYRCSHYRQEIFLCAAVVISEGRRYLLLAFTLGTIAYICGGNYYLHYQQEFIFILAAGIITYTTSRIIRRVEIKGFIIYIMSRGIRRMGGGTENMK